MLAYRSASHTCSETTNMVYGISRFLAVAVEVNPERYIDGKRASVEVLILRLCVFYNGVKINTSMDVLLLDIFRAATKVTDTMRWLSGFRPSKRNALLIHPTTTSPSTSHTLHRFSSPNCRISQLPVLSKRH